MVMSHVQEAEVITNQMGDSKARSTRSAKVAVLEEKLHQLKAREQAVEARRRTLESRRSRKADTRRKILMGAIVLARVESGEIAEAELRRWLDAALTRDDDRGSSGCERMAPVVASLTGADYACRRMAA
jgi:hypothetical protein